MSPKKPKNKQSPVTRSKFFSPSYLGGNVKRRLHPCNKVVVTAALAAAVAIVSPSSSTFPGVAQPVVGLSTTSTGNGSNSPRRTLNMKESTPRTRSFGAVTSDSFPNMKKVEPHTLILGTHPSITSLKEQQYFGHPVNAFWWIAGDCLGFRRAIGIGKTGEPYALTQHVQHDETMILTYQEQLQCLVSRGFCLWDLVAECKRPGSLDADIVEEVPNDIRRFCREHSTIQRIVFANGSTGAAIFKRHFRDWLALSPSSSFKIEEPTLRPLEGHKASEQMFTKKQLQDRHRRDSNSAATEKKGSILLVTALGVSPAAARYSYAEKQRFWKDNVYGPGLKDWENSR